MACPTDRAERPVSRTEIVDHIAAAFRPGPASRSDLVRNATEAGARAELLAVLETLPAGRYRRPSDLWVELPHLPVEA